MELEHEAKMNIYNLQYKVEYAKFCAAIGKPISVHFLADLNVLKPFSPPHIEMNQSFTNYQPNNVVNSDISKPTTSSFSDVLSSSNAVLWNTCHDSHFVEL